MEENSSSDDETKMPVSPKLGGKKVKLNDGSSQDSFKEPGPLTTATGSKNEKDENADSGLSVDKSESTSSEDRTTGIAAGPQNELVAVAPSSSNVTAILLNIRRPRRLRNYRKRKTPGRDSDSNSSRDSDDLSGDEAQEFRRVEIPSDLSSSTEFSDNTPSVSTSSVTSGDGNSNNSNDADQMHSDTDSEGSPWLRSFEQYNRDEDENEKTPPVLLKPQPKHTYRILREIINREMGLTFPTGKTVQNDVMFEQNFYGSLHAIYRLEKLHNLLKHKGCVNSINFHPEGHLLASGSDDKHVVIWDWARNKALHYIKTGHKSNVFQSKFLHLNTQSQLNIATCARDGQVRLVTVGGSGAVRRRLAAHARPAHKLHVSRADPHQVLSAGEDGLVLASDVRRDRPAKLIHVKSNNGSVALFSIAGHPLGRPEVLVAGRDKTLRVYDTRRAAAPLATYCPGHFRDPSGKGLFGRLKSFMHLTCAVYNHDGTEILGSYNDEDVYLFDAKNDIYDEASNDGRDGYTNRYSGHRNSATIKGVSFFGPRSQYVVSGSDCGHVYVWDKHSAAIVQWLDGDLNGVVNCIEGHPRFPVMATSGLDKDVKIWIPKRQEDPDYNGMQKIVRGNSEPQRSPLFSDFLPSMYSAWSGEGVDVTARPNIEFDGNMCAAI